MGPEQRASIIQRKNSGRTWTTNSLTFEPKLQNLEVPQQQSSECLCVICHLRFAEPGSISSFYTQVLADDMAKYKPRGSLPEIELTAAPILDTLELDIQLEAGDDDLEQGPENGGGDGDGDEDEDDE